MDLNDERKSQEVINKCRWSFDARDDDNLRRGFLRATSRSCNFAFKKYSRGRQVLEDAFARSQGIVNVNAPLRFIGGCDRFENSLLSPGAKALDFTKLSCLRSGLQLLDGSNA